MRARLVDRSGVRALVTGATGFVGRRLAERLIAGGAGVRCLVRDRRRAADLAALGAELHEGDVLEPATLAGAGRDVDVAYYLIHSMGRGGGGDFEQRERRAARAFAELAAREGVARTVYLGGLGDGRASRHLRARQETAELLARHGPPLTHFRAGMVVGSAERVVPDAAPPGRAAAGDDRAGLALDRDAADRDRRRALLPRARARRGRVRGPRGADRRSRRR